MMVDHIDIGAFDDEFAARMTPPEWHRIATFRNHPHFLKGVARHDGAMRPLFGNNFLLSKVVTEAWRFQILTFILYLHEAFGVDDPHNGLTLSNLQKICSRLGLASPGRVYAYLNILKLAGYLASERSAIDARVTMLIPTDRFMKIVEQWNDNIFASIDAANPDAALTRWRSVHPELGRGMRTSGAEGLLAGWRPLAAFPEVEHFASSDGGWMMMEYVVARQIGDDGRLRAMPVNLKLRQQAQLFGGSRTNLVRLLDEAAAQGLITEPSKGGQNVVFAPRMTCAFLAFIASYLSNFEHHARIALKRMQDGSHP